ncbi:uncharacterized protein [Hetaerina americana]|uniref:uncharacterized protein n=1 Tax=Hetaerina americana TaxID=62018 RepID=UPI003A7F6032
MCDKIDFVVCRLCLNSGGELVNIFDENNKTEFMLEKTIEDLVNVKVVEDKRYPWLVCSTCMEKLTEFRLFKHRCAECLFVFYNRIQKGCNPAAKYLIINREEEKGDVLRHDNKGVGSPGEDLVDGTSTKVWALSSAVDNSVRTATVEMDGTYSVDSRVNWMAENNCSAVDIQFPGGIKREIDDDAVGSDDIERTAVGVGEDMTVVKQEIDAAGGCTASPGRDIDSSVVPSMQEGGSHWSGNDEAGNLDRSEDEDSCLPINLDVEIKEECDADEPQEVGGLGKEVSQLRGGDQGQDGTGNSPHTCQICKQDFAEEDILKAHLTRVHRVKRKELRCDVCSKALVGKGDVDGCADSEIAPGKKHQCQSCSAVFSSKKDLRRHVLTHGYQRGVHRNRTQVLWSMSESG